MGEVVGGAVAPVGHHEVLEIGQRQLPFHQQHAGIHAEGAVAAQRDDDALRRAQRDAGGEQRGEAHRCFEIEHALGLAGDLPPQLGAVAGGGDDDVVLEPLAQQPEAILEAHVRLPPAARRA